MNKMLLNYSTYARTILSDLKIIAKLIRKYSTTKQSKQLFSTMPPMLQQSQIEEALLNPQNSIDLSIAANASLLKMHRDILNAKEQASAQRRLLKESTMKLEAREAAQTNQLHKQHLTDALASLRGLQSKVTQQLKELIELENQLEPIDKNLEKTTLECDNDWETYRTHYLQSILAGFTAAGIVLNDLETDDLLAHETWSDIFHNYESIPLDLPNFVSVEQPNYSSYFALKGYLTLYISLNRQGLAHSPDDIATILKPLLKD